MLFHEVIGRFFSGSCLIQTALSAHYLDSVKANRISTVSRPGTNSIQHAMLISALSSMTLTNTRSRVTRPRKEKEIASIYHNRMEQPWELISLIFSFTFNGFQFESTICFKQLTQLAIFQLPTHFSVTLLHWRTFIDFSQLSSHERRGNGFGRSEGLFLTELLVFFFSRSFPADEFSLGMFRKKRKTNTRHWK